MRAGYFWWLPGWLLSDLLSARDLTKLNLFRAKSLSKPVIERAPEPDKT